MACLKAEIGVSQDRLKFKTCLCAPMGMGSGLVSGWSLENQATAYTEAVAQRLRDDRAHIPALW